MSTFLARNHHVISLLAGTIPENPPVKLNPTLKLQDPFHLATFIKNNREEIDTKGFIQLFQRDDFTHQFKVGSSAKTRPCNIHRIFSAVKMEMTLDFIFYIFNIFAQNIYCGYTLEPSRNIKVRFKGVYILWTCFPDDLHSDSVLLERFRKTFL